MIVYKISDFGFSYPFANQKIQLTGEFVIHQGDFILLQGASGSGKSTILAAFKGLIPHLISGTLSGKILYKDQDISHLNEQDLLTIGYLQQNPDSQIVCPNVFDELAFGLENQGLAREVIEQQIVQIMDKFNLAHLLNREVKTLSGGEKQKINLIAILLLKPEVLLLDEPTAFLDPISAHEIMNILTQYATTTTIVIVEHNLHFLQNLVNRVIQINENGAILEADLLNIEWNEQLPKQNCKSSNHNPDQILSCKNLSYSYSIKQTLLDNINFEMNRGDVIAIKGKNGTGKSTLMKLIAGITPSKQEIYLDNVAVHKLATNQRWQKLSLLWQNPEAHFLFNYVEQEINDIQIIADFRLTDQAKQSPFTLSEGQKRRLSLAIVLQNKPFLILLDEPTFGQDYENKLSLVKLINQLSADGVSFLIVSHDNNFIQAVANKVFTLEQGQLHQCEI